VINIEGQIAYDGDLKSRIYPFLTDRILVMARGMDKSVNFKDTPPDSQLNTCIMFGCSYSVKIYNAAILVDHLQQ
jgi:hypothetical protein